LPSWSSTTIESNKLKETVYDLAKSGEVTGSDLTKHEKQLSTLGTGQSQHESGYVLKILRLEIALTGKSREIKQRAEAFESLNPKRMKELAKVSPRQQRAIPKLRDSQVVRNFERDYLTYRQIVNDLLTHTEYKNAFPGEHAVKLKEAIGEMSKQLINLDNQVSLVQVALYD
jgi:hypothetical protein